MPLIPPERFDHDHKVRVEAGVEAKVKAKVKVEVEVEVEVEANLLGTVEISVKI